MIHFEFSDLHTDPRRFEKSSDAIFAVEGLFELRVDHRLLYSEPDFLLVEFVRALNSWLKRVVDSGQDFEYESMDAEEPGLVWIRRHEDGWRIGSIFQEYPEVRTFSLEEIQMSANDLTKRLTEEARTRLGLDLANLLEERRRRRGRSRSRLRLASIVAFGMGCFRVLPFLILKDPGRQDTASDLVSLVVLISIPFVGGRVLSSASSGASLVVAVSGYGGLLVSVWAVAILESEGSFPVTVFLMQAPAYIVVYWLVVHWVSKWGRDRAISELPRKKST